MRNHPITESWSGLAMRCISARWVPVFCFFISSTIAAAQQPSHLEVAKSKSPKPAAKAIASSQLLFGSLPISTRFADVRGNLEMALDQYENAGFDQAIMHAQMAAEKDPNLAVGYAIWSFTARRSTPNEVAFKKAKSLAAHCSGDECLLVTFLVGAQEANVLPAIAAMNDLVARRPKDKHILYLAGEWLFFQGDYDHAMKLWDRALALDPDFPAALNMLGYSYLECSNPDPRKAVEYLKHYAAVLPQEANPQDSLGEVLRMAGDDSGSLAHYAEALRISPTYVTSQYGRGDTYALMGDSTQALAEYEKALKMVTVAHDGLHIQFQKALLLAWQGDVSGARVELARLSEKFAAEKDAAAQFEVGYARALLAADPQSELQILHELETSFGGAREGMPEADRVAALANVLREQVRLHAASRNTTEAASALLKLQQLSETSRELIVEDILESARGYVSAAAGDYQKAADQLSADMHSPFVVREFVLAQEKLGNAKAAETAQARLKYLRTPTAEWFVATHSPAAAAQIAAH
jgi:tetratricopeptide (TPR) repeat protein